MFSQICGIVSYVLRFICIECLILLHLYLLVLICFCIVPNQHRLRKLVILLLLAILIRLRLIVLVWCLALLKRKVVWNQWNISLWLTNWLLLLLSLGTRILIAFHASFQCSVGWWIVITYLRGIGYWLPSHDHLLLLCFWIDFIIQGVCFLFHVACVQMCLYRHWIAFLPVNWSVFTSSGRGSADGVYLPHLDHWGFYLQWLLSARGIVLGGLLLVDAVGRVMLSLLDCQIWLICVQAWVRFDDVGLCCLESALSYSWVMIATHRFVLIRLESAKLPIRCLSLSRGEEHRIQIIKMHLLQLRVMNLIRACCKVWLLCVLMLRCALDCHKWCKWPHRAHRCWVVVFQYLVLMVLHHLISVFSPWFTGSYWTNFLRHSLVQVLLLLLLIQSSLYTLIRLYLVRVRRVYLSHSILEILLYFAALQPLRSVGHMLPIVWCLHLLWDWRSLYTRVQVLVWVSFLLFVVFIILVAMHFLPRLLLPHPLLRPIIRLRSPRRLMNSCNRNTRTRKLGTGTYAMVHTCSLHISAFNFSVSSDILIDYLVVQLRHPLNLWFNKRTSKRICSWFRSRTWCYYHFQHHRLLVRRTGLAEDLQSILRLGAWLMSLSCQALFLLAFGHDLLSVWFP